MVEWMHEVDSYVRVGGSLDIEKMWDDVECTFWNNKQIIDRISFTRIIIRSLYSKLSNMITFLLSHCGDS